MYGKLFSSMFDGSLYGNWKAIVTLQQLVILSDRGGFVDMTPQAIAARTSIPLDIIQEGLALLEQPDKYSRTDGNEGRRIELIDNRRPWGWHIVNYEKYRQTASAEEKREADRARIASKRTSGSQPQETPTESATSQNVADSRERSHEVANVAYAEAEAEANTDALSTPPNRGRSFDVFWEAYPKKNKRKEALKVWQQKKLDELASVILADVRQRPATERWRNGFIPDPPTYLRGERWNDALDGAQSPRPYI